MATARTQCEMSDKAVALVPTSDETEKSRLREKDSKAPIERCLHMHHANLKLDANRLFPDH